MLTYNNLSVDIYTLQYKFKKLNIYPGNFSYFSTLIFKNKKHMFTLRSEERRVGEQCR